MLKYKINGTDAADGATAARSELERTNEGPKFRARGTECGQVVHRVGDDALAREQNRTLSRQAAAGTMMAGLLHELASALTISSFSRMVLNDYLAATTLPSDVAESISQLDSSTDHMLSLFEALRAFVRNEQSHYEPCSVRDLMASVGLLCHGYVDSRVRLEIDPMPDATILVSEPLFLQVVMGLIKNAVEASPPQGRIRISATIDDQRLCVSVSDDGPGVSPSELHRLFKPLATSKSASGGSGLGLAMARAIVSEFHGTISYAPSSSGGAQLSVCLPMVSTRTSALHLSAAHLGG